MSKVDENQSEVVGNESEDLIDPPTVFRVHGTFAGNKYQSYGWHRVGSSFSNVLRNKLGERKFELASNLNWKSDNLESERSQAAKRLLNKLIECERDKQDYHIIAHSHGGSVVWLALVLAESRRRRNLIGSEKKYPRKGLAQLQHLKSWTTIGSPFLSFSPTVAGRIIELLGTIAVLWLGAALVEAVLFVNDIDLGELLGNNLGDRPLLLVGLIFTVFLLFEFVSLLYLSIRSMLATREARKHYIDKWVGITSKHDEAVNGLKFASESKGSVMSRVKSNNGIYISKYAKFLRQVLLSPFRLVLNYVLVPLGDVFVRRQLKRYALGDDQPFTKVSGVGTTPVPGVEIPELPAEIESHLSDGADKGLTSFVPKLRGVLKESVTAAGKPEHVRLDVDGELFTGSELIHTSYLENEGVQDLIVEHILSQQYPDKSEKDSWVARFKKIIHDKLENGKSNVKTDRLHVFVIIISIVLVIYAFYAFWDHRL